MYARIHSEWVHTVKKFTNEVEVKEVVSYFSSGKKQLLQQNQYSYLCHVTNQQ